MGRGRGVQRAAKGFWEKGMFEIVTVQSVRGSRMGKQASWILLGTSPRIGGPAQRRCPLPVLSHSEQGAGLEAGELGRDLVNLFHLCFSSQTQADQDSEGLVSSPPVTSWKL